MTASGQCITCVASRNALCHEHRRESLMGMRIIIDGRRKSYVPFIKCNLTCICTLQNSQAMLCGYFRRYLKNSHLKFYILQFYKILHCPFGKNSRYLPLPFLNTNSHDGHQRQDSSIPWPGCNPLVTRRNLWCDVLAVCPHYATHPLHHRALITLRLVKWVSIMCHVTLVTWHVTLSRALTWHDDTPR